MEKGSPKRYRNVLRLLGFVAAVAYVGFLIGEVFPKFEGTTWELITTLLLFVVFLAGLFYLFKREMLAGILWIAWYGLLILLVVTLWVGAGLTVVMGLPIFILGLLVLVHGIKHGSVPQHH